MGWQTTGAEPREQRKTGAERRDHGYAGKHAAVIPEVPVVSQVPLPLPSLPSSSFRRMPYQSTLTFTTTCRPAASANSL